MEKTTISQLKARLSAYLKKVRAGQTILIFDRDEPIARLESVNAGGRAGSGEDRVVRLERAGLLRRGARAPSPLPLRAAAPRAHARRLQGLLAVARRGRSGIGDRRMCTPPP